MSTARSHTQPSLPLKPGFLHAGRRRQQRGMTLIVGLVLLVMLMVISVIGFRNTTLSERMTGNVVDRNVSFQSAESAGKEALQVIESLGFATANVGHYAYPSKPLADGGSTTFWTQGAGAATATCTTTTPFSWTSCAAPVATKYGNNAENAQYVIELLSDVTAGGNQTTTYRVTSRSTGGSGNADVVLQVMYIRTIVVATP